MTPVFGTSHTTKELVSSRWGSVLGSRGWRPAVRLPGKGPTAGLEVLPTAFKAVSIAWGSSIRLI